MTKKLEMRFVILALHGYPGVCMMIAKLFMRSDLQNDHCATVPCIKHFSQVLVLLHRKKGACGICNQKGIKVEVMRNGDTFLQFFPSSENAAKTFTVIHSANQLGTPRLIKNTHPFFLFFFSSLSLSFCCSFSSSSLCLVLLLPVSSFLSHRIRHTFPKAFTSSLKQFFLFFKKITASSF